jgi:hypothetical protein
MIRYEKQTIRFPPLAVAERRRGGTRKRRERNYWLIVSRILSSFTSSDHIWFVFGGSKKKRMDEKQVMGLLWGMVEHDSSE